MIRHLILVVVLVASGCGPGVVGLRVKNALDDARQARKGQPAQPRDQREIVVQLQAPRAVGCSVLPVGAAGQQAGPLGNQVCAASPLGGSDEDAEEEEVQARVKQQGGVVGMVVRQFGESVRLMLQEQLSRRFGRATVVAGGAAASGAVVVEPRLTLYVGNGTNKNTQVALTARVGQGQPITVTGSGNDSVSAGHLGWMIPACLASGLLPCAAWMPMAGQALHAGASERSVALAIDDAAAKLAARLAGQALPPAPAAAPSRAATAPASPARAVTAAAATPRPTAAAPAAPRRSVAPRPAGTWFYRAGRRRLGPVSDARIRDLFRGGQLDAASLVWSRQLRGWTHLCNVPAFAGLVSWYYLHNGQRRGPATAVQLRRWVRAGSLPASTSVWRKGYSGWVALSTLPEFADLGRQARHAQLMLTP